MEQFNDSVKSYLSFIDDNEYLSAGLSLFLILYAGLAAPQLPEYIARLFDNPIFKLVIFFLIAYSAKKNPTVAIIASVGLMISLYTLSRIKLNKSLMSLIKIKKDQNGANSAENLAEKVEAMQNGNGHDGIEVQSTVEQENVIPAAALTELQEEEGSVIAETLVPPAGCTAKADYRNSFYPQYVNMSTDNYNARYTGADIGGYDISARYHRV